MPDGAARESGTPSTTTFLRGDQTWAVPGAGGSVNLDDLADVLITSPADNQVLSYDAAGARWINEAAAAGGATTLDALTDTTITTPADNQVLTYDSTTSQWRNETPPVAGRVATDVIWDAAGDLAVGSGANTAAQIGHRHGGHCADVSTGSAAAWQAPAGGGATLDPVTTLQLVDDFLHVDGHDRQHRDAWAGRFTGGALASIAAEANHPGILAAHHERVDGNVATLFWTIAAIDGHVLPGRSVRRDVDRAAARPTTRTRRSAAGCYRADGNPPTDGIYLEKLDSRYVVVRRDPQQQLANAHGGACGDKHQLGQAARTARQRHDDRLFGGRRHRGHVDGDDPDDALSPVLQIVNDRRGVRACRSTCSR